MMANPLPKVGAGLVLAMLLSGCSLFGGAEKAKPAPLETLGTAMAGKVVWSAQLQGAQFPLAVLARDQQFVLAGGDGVVQALQADTGAALWRSEALGALSAGVGSDGRFAAVVTRSNDLVLLDAGKTVWRKPLNSPVITAPLVAGERVFVLTVDRAVHAFDALDGKRLWDLRRPGEPLTLSQAGVLGSYKDTLIVGQGPRMAGVDPLRGTLRWEANVANPRGTNEVERLADLVAPHVRVDNLLCARAFQAAVGCVNAERGSALWSRNNAGAQGLAGDAQLLVGGDSSDRLSAWKTANGDLLWTAEQFLNRRLSAPLLLGQTVVVGDGEGYVHFLARDSGKTQLRLPTDGSPITTAPVALGNTLLVVTRRGGVYAMRPE